MRESIAKARIRAERIYHTLSDHYPPTGSFLTHDTPFELLIAVILSAQCTDARVNMVTPALFKAHPTPLAMANATIHSLESAIQSINFFKTKAKHINATAHIIHHQYNDTVPACLEALIQLPGVGRKTANVVLGQAFNIPGITVDTHVKRLSQRLGFSVASDPVKIEKDTMKRWPKDTWIDLSSLLILHGRHVCNARKPRCHDCVISDDCPAKAID